MSDESPDKENIANANASVEAEVPPPKESDPAIVAPSPNALRKRRRAEIARKVEGRKGLITAASSSRLDMTKVHSILSGPRLSWDWQSGPSGSAASAKGEEDLDDDSCGLIVDFHQDSRSALKTHISKAMSQMASREMSSQSVASVTQRKGSSDELKEIIQMKRRLISSQVTTVGEVLHHDLPDLEPILPNLARELEPSPDEVTHWQETQMPSVPVPDDDACIDATQVFVRLVTPLKEADPLPAVEEEIDMDGIELSGQSGEIEPTQIYIPAEDVEAHARQSRELVERVSSLSIPPNSVRDHASSEPEPAVISEGESEHSEPDKSAKSSESSESEASVAPKKKSKAELNFDEWLLERKRRKKASKQQSKEAKSFFEAEAEESEDDQLGGIMRRGGSSGDEGSSDGSSEDSDLEDLVASAADEFALLKGTKKDSKRLGKLHAKWQEERDKELEKAIEEKNFWKKKGARGLGRMDDGEKDGLTRMQRKLKARADAMVQRFDAEGNALAPEYESESDYDSMEIDSDDFDDEFSDQDDDGRVELNEEELALRKERRQREIERRKRDMELKIEMKNRRQLLKAKLREERANKEKDKREIQAGLGIMTEEDRQVFKLVNRTQGVFGYTQVASGTTTQSTSASVSTQQSPVFSFLSSSASLEIKPKFSRRRSSVGSLELE